MVLPIMIVSICDDHDCDADHDCDQHHQGHDHDHDHEYVIHSDTYDDESHI